MLDPRTVVLKEDLLAMKDTARSSGSLFIQGPSLGWFFMSVSPKLGMFTEKGRPSQVNCLSTWFFTTPFREAMGTTSVILVGEGSSHGQI